jgi:hypothetical protein
MLGRRKLFYTLLAPTLRQFKNLNFMAHLERRLFFFLSILPAFSFNVSKIFFNAFNHWRLFFF